MSSTPDMDCWDAPCPRCNSRSMRTWRRASVSGMVFKVKCVDCGLQMSNPRWHMWCLVCDIELENKNKG